MKTASEILTSIHSTSRRIADARAELDATEARAAELRARLRDQIGIRDALLGDLERVAK